MTRIPVGFDSESLRRMLRAGGLEVGEERAQKILPVALALLRGADRLADRDLDRPGGSGISHAPRDEP
jgi:hypothetical protein